MKKTISQIIIIIILIPYISTVAKSGSKRDKPGEIVTDRPGQTQSSKCIPKGTIQIEGGFLYEIIKKKEPKESVTTYNTTLLRLGLIQGLELRLGLDYKNYSRNIEYTSLEHPEGTGEYFTVNNQTFSPLSAGFKADLLKEKDFIPELAFIGSLSLPFTADKPYRPDHIAPAFKFAGSYSLPVISVGFNLGGVWDGDNPYPTGIYTLIIGNSFMKNFRSFFEIYGFVSDGMIPDYRFDAGITYLLFNNLQIDISAGTGIAKYSDYSFAGFGISWRLPE